MIYGSRQSKILDEITHRYKIVEIVENTGDLISFGHTLFELTNLSKLLIAAILFSFVA